MKSFNIDELESDEILNDFEDIGLVSGVNSTDSNLRQLIDNLNEHKTTLSNFPCSKAKLLKLVISSIVGVGTGLAMMPIFDAELEKLEDIGIDIETNVGISAVTTINTLLIFSSVASITIYHLLGESTDHDKTALQKIALDVGKVAAVCSSVLPLSQLWTVELENREYVESSGFDKYIAWAAATSIPLCVYKSLDAYEYIKDFVYGRLDSISLNSVGDKLFVYAPTVLAAAGRFIAYTASAAYLGMELGIDEEVSIALGSIIGGVMGSGVIGIAEYVSLKSLFEARSEPLSYKQIIGGGFCALEGVLLTLPLISTGLTAMEEWNPFIKGFLLAPLLVSHSILEGRVIYKAYEHFASYFKHEDDQLQLEVVGTIEDYDIIT